MSRVVVAMSGGGIRRPAALLREQGHEVIGMMLRLWSEPGKRTQTAAAPDSMAQARRVAARLGIPLCRGRGRRFPQTVVQYFWMVMPPGNAIHA
jgi:tRNA-specific 2-thiouridylase